MIKFKMTKAVKSQLSKEVLKKIEIFIDSLLEDNYIGVFRHKKPVDRKENLVITVEPIEGEEILIYASIIDKNKEPKILGRICNVRVKPLKVILLNCSFGRTYNMLTIA